MFPRWRIFSDAGPPIRSEKPEPATEEVPKPKPKKAPTAQDDRAASRLMRKNESPFWSVTPVKSPPSDVTISPPTPPKAPRRPPLPVRRHLPRPDVEISPPSKPRPRPKPKPKKAPTAQDDRAASRLMRKNESPFWSDKEKRPPRPHTPPTVPIPDVLVPGHVEGTVKKNGRVHVTSAEAGTGHVTTLEWEPTSKERIRQAREELEKKGYGGITVRAEGDRYVVEGTKKVRKKGTVRLPYEYTISPEEARQIIHDYAKEHGLGRPLTIVKEGDKYVAEIAGEGTTYKVELPAKYVPSPDEVREWAERAGLKNVRVVSAGDKTGRYYEVLYDTEVTQKATASLPAFSLAVKRTTVQAPPALLVGIPLGRTLFPTVKTTKSTLSGSGHLEPSEVERRLRMVREYYGTSIDPQTALEIARMGRDDELLRAIGLWRALHENPALGGAKEGHMSKLGLNLAGARETIRAEYESLPESVRRKLRRLLKERGKKFLEAYYKYYSVEDVSPAELAATAAGEMAFGWIPVGISRGRHGFHIKTLDSAPISAKTWGDRYKNWIYAGKAAGLGLSFALGEGIGATTGLAAGSRGALRVYSGAQNLYRLSKLNRVFSSAARVLSRVPGSAQIARSAGRLITTPGGQVVLLTLFEAPKAYSEYKSGYYTPVEVVLHAGRDYALAGGFERGFSAAFKGTPYALEKAKLKVGQKYGVHDLPYKKVSTPEGAESYELSKFGITREPFGRGTLKTYSARSYVERYLPANGRTLNSMFRQEIRFSKIITPEGNEVLVVGPEPHYMTVSRAYYTTPVEEGKYFFKDIDALGDLARTFKLYEKPETWQYGVTPVNRNVWRYLRYSRMGKKPFSLAYRPATASEAFSQTKGIYYLGKGNVETLETPAGRYTVGRVPESVAEEVMKKYRRGLEYWTRYRAEGAGKLVPRETRTVRRFASPDVQRGWAYEWIKGRNVATMGRKLPTPGEQYSNYLLTGEKGYRNPYTIVDDTGHLERLRIKVEDIFSSLRNRLPRFSPTGETTRPATTPSARKATSESAEDVLKYLQKWNGRKPSQITRFTATEIEEGTTAGSPTSGGLLVREVPPEEVVRIVEKGTTRANIGARLLRTGIKDVTSRTFHVVPPLITPASAIQPFSVTTSQATQVSKTTQTTVPRTITTLKETLQPTHVQTLEPQVPSMHITTLVPKVAEETLLKFRRKVTPRVTVTQREATTLLPTTTLKTRSNISEESVKITPSVTPAVKVSSVAPPLLPPPLSIAPPSAPIFPPFPGEPGGQGEYGPMPTSGLFAYWVGAAPFLGGGEEVIVVPRNPRTPEEKLFRDYFEWLMAQGFSPPRAAEVARRLVVTALLKRNQRRASRPLQRMRRNVPLVKQPLQSAPLSKFKPAALSH